MKKYLFAFVAIVILMSCNQAKNGKSQDISGNALLAKKVIMDVRISFENIDNPEWVKGFNSKEFIEMVFSKTLSGEFKDFYMERTDNYTLNDIRLRMGEHIDTILTFNNKTRTTDTTITKNEIQLSEIKEVNFKEEWYFDKEKLTFKKNILSWTPIRKYFKSDDVDHENPRFRTILSIKKDDKSNFTKKIAEDIIYVFDIFSEYESRIGIDMYGFFEFLLKNIDSGKIKTYDPIYLVDKSKREFSIDQLKENSVIPMDPDEFSMAVNKLIFIEDWLLDEKTFNIKKVVKGLGFIAEYGLNRDEKILFFIFFD